MKVLAYLRVSSDDQREAGTIAMQRDVLARWAQRHGVEIAGWYEDDGVTGTLLLGERPGGARLLAEAAQWRAAGVTHVAIYDWSRMGREPWVVWGAVYDLEKKFGFRIKSATEDADTSTPERVLMLCVGTGVASLERAKILQRSRDAMNMLAEQGVWLGGIAPFGYRVEGHGRTARLMPDEEPLPGISPEFGLSPAGVVRLIYTWAGQGASLNQMCDRLNALGIPASFRRRSPGTPGGRAEAWAATRLSLLLRNPVYRGERQWGRSKRSSTRPREVVSSSVPALVEPDVWEAAQETMLRNRRFAKRNTRREYLLRGLLRCAQCGYSLVGRACGEVRYYACWGSYSRSRPNAPNCRMPYANATELETQVWQQVEALLRNPKAELTRLAAEREGDAGGAELIRLADGLRAKLAGKEQERARVIGFARTGLITEQELASQLAELRREDDAIRKELARIEPEARVLDLQALRRQETVELLDELGGGLDEVTWERQRQLLERLVERVLVAVKGRQRRRVPMVWLHYRL